jgi:F-type H+-transporting ATPase subunit epsilon
MSVSLELNVVTPERQLVSKEILSVIIPGAEGDFGVLPGHTPFLSLVKAGILEIEGEGNKEKFVISSGYAEVLPDRVTLLIDQGMAPSKIDLVGMEAEMAQLNETLTNLAPEDPDFNSLNKRRDFVSVCIDVLKQK